MELMKKMVGGVGHVSSCRKISLVNLDSGCGSEEELIRCDQKVAGSNLDWCWTFYLLFLSVSVVH